MSLIVINFAAMPKARPIVTDNGTYMPEEYTDWKEAVMWALREQNIQGVQYESNVSLEMVLHSTSFEVQITPSDIKRPKHVRGDIDNLCGGFMDAVQEYGIIKDDRQFVQLEARME